MLEPSVEMTKRYNLDEMGILRAIGKPFNIWTERDEYDNIDGETLLVELDEFHQWYKEKKLADDVGKAFSANVHGIF